MNFFNFYLTEEYKLEDFGFKKVSNKNLRIGTVYRTPQAHKEYKGKFVYGKGLYTSLSKEEAKELTIDPHSDKIVHYDEKINGPIETYSVLYNMPLVEINIDEGNDLDKWNKLIKTIGLDNINEFFISNGVAGLVVRSEDFNYGGNQLVVYNTKHIRRN